MAITVELKVIPSSGRSGWVRDKSGMLKCFLKSPPEKGKANEELIKVVSKAVGLSMRSITIISGYQSRKKVIKIDADISQEIFLRAVGIDDVKKANHVQMHMFDQEK